MKKMISLLVLAGVISSMALPVFAMETETTAETTTTAETPDFPDVSGDLYEKGINFLAKEKILQGQGNGRFAPDQDMNRAELMTAIARGLKAYNNWEDGYFDEYDQACFTDIEVGQWYTRFVCYAKAQGFVEGYADGTFRPAQPVSATEAIKMVATAFGIDYEEGDDYWYRPIVERASEYNFIPFDLDDFEARFKRRQMADMIARMIKASRDELEEYLGDRYHVRVTFDTLRKKRRVVELKEEIKCAMDDDCEDQEEAKERLAELEIRYEVRADNRREKFRIKTRVKDGEVRTEIRMRDKDDDDDDDDDMDDDEDDDDMDDDDDDMDDDDNDDDNDDDSDTDDSDNTATEEEDEFAAQRAYVETYAEGDLVILMNSQGWRDIEGQSVRGRTFTIEKGAYVHFVNNNGTNGTQQQWPASVGNGNNEYPDSSASFCGDPRFDEKNLNACVVNDGTGGLTPGQVFSFRFNEESPANRPWTVIDRLFYNDKTNNNHTKYELKLEVE